MLSKLNIIKETLLKVTNKVYHYQALKADDKYIVWAEDSEGSSVEGDNQKSNQSMQGTIDYFTKTENDENVDKIQAELVAACISFCRNQVQFEGEDDGGAGFIHYEWVFEVRWWRRVILREYGNIQRFSRHWKMNRNG